MKSIALRSWFAILLVGASLLVSAITLAEVAVIVHPDNKNTLEPGEIARIFLGRKTTYPDGTGATPVDQKEDSLVYAVFVSQVLNSNRQRMKAHWAELLFTGRGTPPQIAGSDEEVKKLVSGNPAMIGYIDASKADDSVRVIHSF